MFHRVTLMSRAFAVRTMVVAVLALTVAAAGAANEAAGRTVRLLTVGNSFSQNATHYLGDLAKAAGDILEIHRADIGGSTMQQHWEKAENHERDPQSTNGLYATRRSLKQELTSNPLDFVTIQQASIRSHDLNTYRPYARQLYDYIKKHAPKAEVILHETWAYRVDDPRFAVKSPKAGEPATQLEMYQSLTNAYRTIARELGVLLLPVGEAFYLADTDPKWGFRPDTAFDAKQAQIPALPDQTHSLHAGWRWQKSKTSDQQKLSMDGHHAGVAGEYLGACVFYEVMFGKTVVGNTFTPAGLAPDHARFLQETAHQVVQQNIGR